MMRYRVRPWANHLDDGWQVVRYRTDDDEEVKVMGQYRYWSTAMAVANDLASYMRDFRSVFAAIRA